MQRCKDRFSRMTTMVSMTSSPSSHSYSRPNSRPTSEIFAYEKVLVVLDGSKQITKYALEWALSNVLVRPGESITLLALHARGSHGPVRRILGFPMSLQMLGRDCALPRVLGGVVDTTGEAKGVDEAIYEGCNAMIRHFQQLCHQKKITIDVKVLEVEGREASAIEARRIGATWVVLDKHLKKEAKVCMELLQCNIVIVKPSEPKILRLNLKRNSRTAEPPAVQFRGQQLASTTVHEVLSVAESPNETEGHGVASVSSNARSGPYARLKASCTPLSSPEEVMTPFTPSDPGTSSKSSLETSPCQGSGPLAINGSSAAGLVVRGSILEGAGAGILGKGASFRAFYPDISDGIVVPGVLTMESSPNTMVHKFKQGHQQRSPTTEFPKPPTGSRVVVPGRPGSRSGSRNGSQANSRKGSPVKTPSSIQASPSNPMNGNRRESFEGRVAKRDHTLGQSLRAILQENADQDCASFEAGSPSGYHGDQEPSETSPLRRHTNKHGNKADALMRHKMAMMLNKHNLPGPPPLCSTCQHKSPMFGKPPQRYSYRELEAATGAFSRGNFLAEGGFGSVHKGVLPDGQTIAVKQYKLASTQGDKEFCAEVEVLSCAQHRNVVMLIGYCIEGKRRLLVYEFICNGSLDGHLYGAERDKPVLEWSSRHKIAIGVARGLRYLHEDCRVGCIVHRDLRPNNILLTHDFEPMVGDFGLARWQPDGHCGVETRVIGTFGYLAPEYTQNGQITDMADVYSFGVVLLELITGRKAIDINRSKGEQCLTEWARPLLEERGTLPIDPRLENRFSDVEMNSMLHAASCCIRRDPSIRPRMAQVMRMLEGEMIFSATSSPASGYFAGRLNSRSSNHMNHFPVVGSGVREEVKYPSFVSPQSDSTNSNYSSPIQTLGPMTKSPRIQWPPMVSSYISQDGQKLSYEALRAAYMEKVSAHHVTASAYEKYKLGKDF